MERYYRAGKSEREFKNDVFGYVTQNAKVTSEPGWNLAVISFPGVLGDVRSADQDSPEQAVVKLCKQIYRSVNLSNAIQRVLYPETIRVIEKPDDTPKKQTSKRK